MFFDNVSPVKNSLKILIWIWNQFAFSRFYSPLCNKTSKFGMRQCIYKRIIVLAQNMYSNKKRGSYKFLVCWLHKYFIQCMQKVTIFDHNRRLFFVNLKVCFVRFMCEFHKYIASYNTYLFLFKVPWTAKGFFQVILAKGWTNIMKMAKYIWYYLQLQTYYYLHFKAKIFNVIVSKKCKMLPPILINFSSGFVFT